MDVGTLVVTNLASLVVGLVGGYALQFLAAKRAKEERRALMDLATIERCIEIFNARVEYITAYHTSSSAVRDDRQREYHALYYGNLHALPETHVEESTWQAWMRAERDARNGTTLISQLMSQVKDARLTVLNWLTQRRSELVR
jgi:hypothetical protein